MTTVRTWNPAKRAPPGSSSRLRPSAETNKSLGPPVMNMPMRHPENKHSKRKRLSCLAASIVPLLLFLQVCVAAEHSVAVSDFAGEGLAGWREKRFAGQTSYIVTERETKGRVVKAVSRASASGLVREQQVDVRATPFLSWSWKAEKLPLVDDETSKSGDDYAARVYVIFKTGPFFWDTKALNYVWASRSPRGKSWPNAFTSNARMLAVESGRQHLGEWVEQRRNVREDIAELFGLDVETIEAVAIMTDSDNSESEAVAYYGEIVFKPR